MTGPAHLGSSGWPLPPAELRARIVEQVEVIQAGAAGLDPEGPEAAAVVGLRLRLHELGGLVESLRISDALARAEPDADLPVRSGEPPGVWVATLRRALGWSLREMAEASGLSAGVLSDIEGGARRHRPWVATLLAETLSDATGGHVDTDRFAAELIAEWVERAGPVEADQWNEQRLASRRRQAVGGAAMRQRIALRRAWETAVGR